MKKLAIISLVVLFIFTGLTSAGAGDEYAENNPLHTIYQMDLKGMTLDQVLNKTSGVLGKIWWDSSYTCDSLERPDRCYEECYEWRWIKIDPRYGEDYATEAKLVIHFRDTGEKDILMKVIQVDYHFSFSKVKKQD